MKKAGEGIIKRPFYALSNLAYLAVGIIILLRGKGSKLSKAFGYTSIMIGVFSFVYDTTYTYISQLVDLLGMLIFVNLLINLSVKRYSPIIARTSDRKLWLVQTLLVLAGMFCIIQFKSYSGEFVFGTFVVIAIALEIALWLKKNVVNFKLWLQGVALFIVGFAFWLVDSLAIYCVPYNLLNGRGIFHILTAITIYKLYQYYEQQLPNSPINH